MDNKRFIPAVGQEKKTALIYSVGPVMPYINKAVMLHQATNMFRVPGIHHHCQVEIDFKSTYRDEAGMDVWTPHDYRIVAGNLKALPMAEEMRTKSFVLYETMSHVSFNGDATSWREYLGFLLRWLAQRIDGKTSVWITMNSDPVLSQDEYMEILNRVPAFLQRELRDAVDVEAENVAMRQAFPELYATEAKEDR